MTAYIEAAFVKLIFLDEREFETSVDRFRFDPKDYRLEEPLAKDYPLTNAKKIKTSFWPFSAQDINRIILTPSLSILELTELAKESDFITFEELNMISLIDFITGLRAK